MKLRSVSVSSASIDCHSWPGLDFSASILACQKHSHFRRRRARLLGTGRVWCTTWLWLPVSLGDLSRHLSSCLDCLHSPSSQGSDERRQMVTVFASMSLSRTDLISLLQPEQCFSWSFRKLMQLKILMLLLIKAVRMTLHSQYTTRRLHMPFRMTFLPHTHTGWHT